ETVLGMQRCCGKYQHSDNDVGSHATCKQVLPGRTGWTLHYVGFGGLGGKGNTRHAIRYQIDPQYVDGQQWDRHAQDRGEGDGEHFRQVTRQHILDELPDVFVYASSFFDGLDDSREVVVEEDHVRCLFGDVGTGNAHRHADVGLLQRRRIVDAIAGHG